MMYLTLVCSLSLLGSFVHALSTCLLVKGVQSARLSRLHLEQLEQSVFAFVSQVFVYKYVKKLTCNVMSNFKCFRFQVINV